jgi:hypothetical protein
MSRLFLLPGARAHDPAVDEWLRGQPPELSAIARHWFDAMRACGNDVRELIHDDQLTACVRDAAFAYVDAFTAHVNVGFFGGAALDDPNGLLEGSGRDMRHVKIRPELGVDAAALQALITNAYADMKRMVEDDRRSEDGATRRRRR